MLKIIKMISNGDNAKLFKATIIAVFEALFGFIPFGVLYFIISDIIDKTLTNDKFFIYLGIIIIGAIGRIIFSYISIIYSRNEGAIMIKGLRLRLGEHIRKLSLGFFNSHNIGELTNKTLDAVNNIEMIVTHLLTEMVTLISLTIFIIIGLFFVDYTMAIAGMISIPLAYGTHVLGQKLMSKHANALFKSSSRLTDSLLEFVQGIKFIKSFNKSEKKYDDLVEKMRYFKDDSINMEAKLSPIMVITGICIDFGLVMLILIGTYLMLGGRLTVKELIVFFIISSRVYENLKSMASKFIKLKYLTVAGEKIQSIFDEKILSGQGINAKFLYHDIEFENVTFSYNNKEVLKDINLKIPEKTMTAFVGPSGSGKTTMTNLIARFFDTDSGDVKIGGNNIKNIDSENVLNEISMVFQNVTLFRDTIYNNIKIGNQNATKKEIIEAAKEANCHEFISKLPDGYDTMVEENGENLSGGEQQRISIARAMLKDAPIVLLDEATASLDPENEIFIQKAIAKLLKNKTVIVIAHRLKTIKNADKIVVLQKGKIKEEGTHDQLLKNNSIYSKMWNIQQKAVGWQVTN